MVNRGVSDEQPRLGLYSHCYIISFATLIYFNNLVGGRER